ncbi:MAG TPA: Gfo/Idh/MocA family oxidoreductase [Vicinamibacterales bacterium]|nr:Gfo/Idh/MocA family oxidoreductase [Vicinamibacterales bacterium]
MDRRDFLVSTAVLTAGAAARGFASPNETVRMAVVGCGGRGSSHVSAWSGMPNVEIVALCDVDEAHIADKVKGLESKGKKKPATYVDYRKLLEDKSIDAVSLATPNHWHTLQTIWACQAGKDVYVEKPCSHNIFESQQIIAAARKYDRIVQQGSQSRSSPALREAVQRMATGELGDVYMARGLCYKWRDTIGHTPVSAVPAGVDYDLWTGPAPKRDFTVNRFHYNWHWMWDTGNGDLGNQGIHEVDIARWGLGVTHPTKVSAIGGKFMFDDDQETPNTLTASYEFDDKGVKKMMTFEVRHWISPHEAGINGEKPGNTIGNQFYGSKGYLVIDNYNKYYSFMGKEQTPGPGATARDEHWANFIAAVRSRKRGDLNAEIEEGALSCNLMHLANISYRVGRTLHWDAKTMTCIGDPEANKMLTRAYRAPFVVPKNV